ncbi:MAG: TonB-dependent receptor [Acidobacteriota bacterium]
MNSLLPKLSRIFAVSLCLVIIVFVQSSVAQETRGTIRGTVLDPNKQPVFNATVTVIDPSRGTKISLTTNGEGFYQATYLIPGTYHVVVEANGFKKALRENVLLQIAGAVQVDIPLEIGGAQETVTVTTEIPQLNTENASLGQVVDAQRIAELPLVHGDPYTLIGLSPGAVSTGDQRLDRPFEPTHIVGFAVDGVRGNRMDLTIDGVASTATANQNEVIASYVPPSDIVQEFKVQTATFDAQFGNTEGSVTSISIKSGANKFHGSSYLFMEPGQWAANDSFGKARGQSRPDTFSNRVGGYISGPVYIPKVYNGKDKSFFLFGFEAIRDSRPRFDVSNVWVPTAALASGDFSAFRCTTQPPPPFTYPNNCTNIYDPLSRTLVSGTTFSGTQFADPSRATPDNPLGLNIIPANRINDVAKAILPYFGAPKSPGLVGNINDSTLAEVTKPYNNWTFRVDQQLTQNNHMFVRGSWYDRNSLYDRYTDSPYAGTNFIFASRGGVIDDVHTFNSTTFLNIKYGYNRFIRASGAQADAVGFDLTKLWGPTAGALFNSKVGEDIRRFPRFNFPTNGTIGNGLTNEDRPVDSHNVVAVLNKTIGRHSLKFGGELRIYREDDNFASNDQTGQFAFNNTYTRKSTNGSSTSSFDAGPQEVNGLQAFAAFLLGLPSTADITRRADYSEYSKTWGFFAQDDFKLGKNLTINLGLRYEKEQALVERQNKSVSGFDFGFVQPSQTQIRANLTAGDTDLSGQPINPANFNITGGVLFAGKDTGHKLYSTPNNTFLPRFGIAYRVNDRTVVRGGFGLFAGFLGERRGDVFQPGYTQTTTLPLTNLANGAQIPQSISAFPSAVSIIEPKGNSLGKTTGLGNSISFFNPNPKVGKQARWQIGIQRELPWGFVAEAEYVGNYGYDLEIIKDLNALPNQYLIDAGVVGNAVDATLATRSNALGAPLPNPFRNVAGFEGATNAFTGNTIARSQLLRPFPEFTSVLTSVNDGKSWYNSGQFSLQKRFTSGNTIQMAYTWSKWLQATEYLNPADPTPTRMIADQDSPHRFSLSGIYMLPFGKGQKFANGNAIVDRVIGGWQLQGVYQFQVGFPVAFGSNSLTAGTTTGDIFYTGGEIGLSTNEQSTVRWFNTAAFSQVTVPSGHLRTLPFRFTDARRDNINNVDFSLLKNTRITETMKIQIRLEAINAFNHTYFPAPSVALGGGFGTIGIATANQANYARRIQIGFKFLF